MSESPPPIDEFLCQRISEILDLERESIDANATYKQLGLDSMTLIGVAGEIEKYYGLKVEPEALYDHPSISTLSEHLESLR